MTVHRKVYRPYAGEVMPIGSRTWVIARRELRRAWRKKWVRRLLFMSLIPLAAIIFALYVQLVVERLTSAQMFGGNLYGGFYGVQVFFAVLMVAAAGSDVIAKDTASRAHHLYFSRPLRPGHYLLGKVGAVAAVLFALLAPPGILLALADLLLAPKADYGEFGAKVGQIILFGAVASASLAAFIALLSAWGTRARYVGLLWVGIYFFSGVAGGILHARFDVDWAAVIAVHAMLLESARFLLGERPDTGALALIVLLVVGAASLLLLWRRILELERREA